MSLYSDWQAYAEQERSEREHKAFWDAYFEKEAGVYKAILRENTGKLAGKFGELAERFDMSVAEFMGFLDGVNASLSKELKLEKIKADSSLELLIDFEKLYYNMLEAKAPWLYGLPEWEGVLSAEKRQEISKQRKSDHIFRREVKIGRNDPCPCGSGKKYKKCCGANES